MIPGFPDHEISEIGVVRRRSTGKELRRHPGRRGYLYVTLCLLGKQYRRGVHTLVALAFHGPKPFPEAQAAHNDGSVDNNYFRNIRWATCKENHADRYVHGTDPTGSRNGRAKITEDDVRHIREKLRAGVRQEALANEYRVCPASISHIATRKTWSHV